MPRNSGASSQVGDVSGNYDTMQQRGRFYGYRRSYLSLLRGSFSPTALETYKEIALEEPKHIEMLRYLDQNDIPLSEYPLLLEMGPSVKLNLTRKNVLAENIVTHNYRGWFARQLWYANDTSQSQRSAISQLSLRCDWRLMAGSGTNKGTGNFESTLSNEMAREFLINWGFFEAEGNSWSAAVTTLERCQEIFPNVTMVLMGRPQGDIKSLDSQEQYRTWNSDTRSNVKRGPWRKIKQLPSSGDIKYASSAQPTIQVHFVNVRSDDPNSSDLVLPNMLGLTLAFPNLSRVVERIGR
jgi:hypothetical protein